MPSMGVDSRLRASRGAPTPMDVVTQARELRRQGRYVESEAMLASAMHDGCPDAAWELGEFLQGAQMGHAPCMAMLVCSDAWCM